MIKFVLFSAISFLSISWTQPAKADGYRVASAAEVFGSEVVYTNEIRCGWENVGMVALGRQKFGIDDPSIFIIKDCKTGEVLLVNRSDAMQSKMYDLGEIDIRTSTLAAVEQIVESSVGSRAMKLDVTRTMLVNFLGQSHAGMALVKIEVNGIEVKITYRILTIMRLETTELIEDPSVGNPQAT